MVFGILLFFFIVICLIMCLLILIQSDKGGGLSGSIGGLSGASNFLGTQDTANVLTKGTYAFGAVFLTLCILMTFFVPRAGESEVARAVRQGVVGETPAPLGAGSSADDIFGGSGVIDNDAGAGGSVDIQPSPTTDGGDAPE